MPKLYLANPGIHESVTRPIILDITRQLFEATGIPATTNILYPGDTERAKQPGSTINAGDPNFSPATLPFTNRMRVVVEENYEAERMLSTAVMRPEHLPVFFDESIETVIKPVYSSQDITINFQYRAQDKNQAMRWRDEIRGRFSMGREQRLHDITYHYLIPPEFLVILEEIHRMREAVAGYGETFEQWFTKYASQRLSKLSTLGGTQESWGVSERQMRIVGWFDFEGAPEQGEKDSDGDSWTISFGYKFKYDKPIGCDMFYPLMIHNQLIKYRPDQPIKLPDAQLKSYSNSAWNFGFFESGRQLLGIPDGYSVPAWDEFIPASVPVDTLRVVTALCSIDTSEGGDPQLLMSLQQLGGEVEFHPAIVRFLLKEVQNLTKPYSSPFLVNLYRNSQLLPHDKLRIDAGLNVYSTELLSLRNYYHVRIGLVTDLELLSDAAKTRLREDGEALALILSALGAEVCIPPILGNNYVTRAEFTKAVGCSNREKLMRGDGQIRQFNTVQSLTIEAIRAQDHADR